MNLLGRDQGGGPWQRCRSILPGYGLGKQGWVTVYVEQVPAGEREVLLDFVEESYRAVATKTLVKRLDAEIAAAD